MINVKTSEKIIHQLSHASLGARPHPNLAPRPLHDPMADHAIVLYDPTIDNRPNLEEIEAARAEEERKKKEEEARGPHKSLKAILGIQDVKKKVDVKVPVVIDPRLAKILRPHQIEGVKVCQQHSRVWSLIPSSSIDVQPACSMTRLKAVSWPMRWV
jgi:DNA repair and recombination RAD54-like protein